MELNLHAVVAVHLSCNVLKALIAIEITEFVVISLQMVHLYLLSN